MDGEKEKFNAKLFAGTDYRALDIRYLITGLCFTPLFVAVAIAAILVGTEVLSSDYPIPVMIITLFISCLPLAFALFFLIIYGKAYKTAKYVFYNSVEVEAVPLDSFKMDLTSPPQAYVYGITYALLTRPEGLFIDRYRVRCGEDDEDERIFNVINKENDILVKNLSLPNLFRYNGYAYLRYTASYPFRKENDITELLNMRRIKVKINVEKGIALYYKTEYAARGGVENNHL